MVVFEHNAEPKGQQRPLPSPRLVVELVQKRLRSNSSYLALKKVSCEYRDGMLTLCGSLPSYYLKQMAQSVASGVDGVRQVDNQIQVVARGRGR